MMKMSPSSSSNTRWCPTPEQLMVLEELYRRGLRSPTSTQIQKIAAHLSLYGNIQGKNVFYWFQNHKARDRQKLRRKLANQQYQFLHNLPFQGCGACEEVGVMRQTWRCDSPRDCMMRTYGYDSSTVVEVGPTIPCCRSKPLQTLELFPLTSPSSANDQKDPSPLLS